MTLMWAVNDDPESQRVAIEVGVHRMKRCPRCAEWRQCWISPEYEATHIKKDHPIVAWFKGLR